MVLSDEERKANRREYRKKNKEKLNRQARESYLKNREVIIKKTTKYHQEYKEERKEYYSKYYQKIRLEVLARIDPDMKCAVCGCEDTRFLEVNHVKGGGRKEHKTRGKNVTDNLILLIHTGKRGIEDLNLLCKPCNGIDHLEREFGKTGLRVVWKKEEQMST